MVIVFLVNEEDMCIASEKIQTRLLLNDIRIPVTIGCHQGEWMFPKEMRIDVEIYFNEPVMGCRSDVLDDSVCYNKLVMYLLDMSADRSFCLIEHYAAFLYCKLKEYLPKDSARIIVKVTKIDTGIKELNSASFVYGDE